MENKQLRIYIIVKYSLELISHTIAPHNSLQEVFDIPGNSYCNPPCTSLPYSYRTILSMFMLSSIAVKILYFPGHHHTHQDERSLIERLWTCEIWMIRAIHCMGLDFKEEDWRLVWKKIFIRLCVLEFRSSWAAYYTVQWREVRDGR